MWVCSSPVSPFSILASLDFPCMAHASFPKCLSIHCQGLHHTFPRFAQNWMLFPCQIHHEVASGRIHDSTSKDVKNQDFHPAAWNFVHCLPIYASTIVHRCIVLLQLLYRWQHQSRKLWIPLVCRYSTQYSVSIWERGGRGVLLCSVTGSTLKGQSILSLKRQLREEWHMKISLTN
jgi:hypothetical protein